MGPDAMTLDAFWPKKKAGRPRKKKTVKDRIEEIRQERRLAEKAEPLSDFDMAAKIEGLWRKR